MHVQEWWPTLEGASNWSHTDKIKAFAWFLHSHSAQPDFSSQDIRNCFEKIGLEIPKNISSYLRALEEKRPKQILRTGDRYKLEFSVRGSLDQRLGQRRTAIHVHKLLTELPEKLSDTADRAFLEECLICFRHAAFRASVVMAWNLAYDHLCVWVLKKHLSAFNAQFPVRYPNEKKFVALSKRDDFSDWKESQIIEVCKSAGIISGSTFKVLEEKLKRRNLAAHPSGVTTTEPTAEEFIKDIVENVVLKLS